MSTEALENEQKQAEAQASQPVVPSTVSATAPSAKLDADSLASALKSDPTLRSALVEALRPEWQKDTQSVKDKRIAGLTDDVERLKVYIQKTGGDVDAAVREMRVDELLEGRPARGGAESEDVAYMTAKSALILKDAEISFEDPEYRLLVAQYEGRINPNQWVDVVQHFADSRQKKATRQTSVTASAAVGGGGSAAPAGDLDALTEELEAIQSGKRGSLTDPKLQAKRKELRKQLADLTPQRPDIR